MPKQGRVGDTIRFLTTARVLPATADCLRLPVADWLDEIAISPAIDQGMSQGTAGTETGRKYRRALILILCALNGVPIARAQQIAAVNKEADLPLALGNMLLDVERVALPRRLNPAYQQLLAAPAAFLANNRIKTGAGQMVGSGPSMFEMSWDVTNRLYSFEPWSPLHSTLRMEIPGGAYNTAATPFASIVNLAMINGCAIPGTIGFTTQLSGCSILYSVNGANLVMAHVWPNSGAAVRAGIPPVLNAHVNERTGILLTHRMVHEGGLSNPVGGGTFGIYGMVADPLDTGLRLLGPNNVRTHGYIDNDLKAYFVAVKVAGSWQLFGQQNNRGQGHAGVHSFQQIYP
jgi:hypothetical protein